MTQLLDADAIWAFSKELSRVVTDEMENKDFPMVLEGYCSIIIGILLGLRRFGLFGLSFAEEYSQ
jgi:arginase